MHDATIFDRFGEINWALEPEDFTWMESVCSLTQWVLPRAEQLHRVERRFYCAVLTAGLRPELRAVDQRPALPLFYAGTL